MKNSLLYVVIAMFAMFSFWGCSDDDTSKEQQQQIPAVLMGKAYTFEPEDAGEQWKSGKTVGVYMLKENETECVGSYSNVKYQTTVEPQGYFSPADNDNVIYYPQDGSKVDVIAYYPWREDLTDECYPLDVSSQKTDSNFSFLYAGNGKGLSKNNNKIELKFRSVLAQVIFQLKAGDGVTDAYLSESSMKISGMNTKAYFGLLSGQFEHVYAVKDIELVPSTEENRASAQVLPAASTEGYELEIKLPRMGRVEHWKLSEEIGQLKQGMKYTCSVRVDIDKIDVITEEEPIKDWESGGNGYEVVGEENNIQTAIEELPLGIWTKVADPMKEPMDTWCYQYNNGIAVNVERDETLGRNIVHGNFLSGGTWYRDLIAYRMGGAKAQIYTLKFRAKGTSGKKMKCYIKTNDTTTGGRNTNLFVLTELNAGKYTGGVQFTLSAGYEEYSFDFDFSKMVKDVSGHLENALSDATPAALSNFYIAFFSDSRDEVIDFYLDDVVLKKKN